MTDFQKKRKFKKIIYSKLSFAVLFILIFFLGKATYNIYQKSKFSSENYTAVNQEYSELKDRHNMLKSEIERLNTDSGVEEEIRGKFNVAKPGETIVTIVNSNITNDDVDNSEKGFWSKFLDIFR